MIDNRPDTATRQSGNLTAVSDFPPEKISAWVSTVIQSATDGVLVIDAARKLVLVNREAERMFRTVASQILGAPLASLLPIRFRPAHADNLKRLATVHLNGERVTKTRFSAICQRADGEEFSVSASISRISIQDVPFLAIIFRELVTLGGAEIPVFQADRRKRAMSSQQAHEVEKRRFSRELYDELGQRLSVLKLDMDLLENSMSSRDPLLPERIAQMQSLLDNIIARTKNIASSLRPPLLDDFGLVPAITWIVDNFEKKTGIDCDVDSHGLSLKLDGSIESAIFRVVQEGLLNIERHAQAKHAKITLLLENGTLDIWIRDDGIGMTHGSENKNGCYGLIAMQERVYMLGGVISIRNLEPHGAEIHVSIPVEQLDLAGASS